MLFGLVPKCHTYAGSTPTRNASALLALLLFLYFMPFMQPIANTHATVQRAFIYMPALVYFYAFAILLA